MSLFCCNSSTSGTFVSKIATRQVLTFLYPAVFTRSLQTGKWRASRPRAQTTTDFEAWFIRSLATASHCRGHGATQQRRTYIAPARQPPSGKRQKVTDAPTLRRINHIKIGPSETAEEPIQPNTTKEELLALVDDYDTECCTEPILPKNRQGHYPSSNETELIISGEKEDEQPHPHYTWPSGPDVKAQIRLLETELEDIFKDPSEIYKLYRDLPAPRVPYLESDTRHRLLRHLAIVERKDEESMLRYFSVIDDMKNTSIPLTTLEWTSAISFAARYVNRSTEVEVEAALQMWREMEQVVGVTPNDATFNVLFDVACKAGKFTLAEMIYEEMGTRGFKYNRFHHVSQIHFHGLKGESDGARAAYRALVEAGEIVDTVVLNAMISALTHSHEVAAAENVYERMKRAHLGKKYSRLPPKDFKLRRALNRALLKHAKLGREDPEKFEEFREKSIIAPDTQTFRILINYFAIRAGELDKVAKYLDDMKLFEIPLHGALFLALLKGFTLHGGIRYTEWTDDKLESVWESFIRAIDDGAEGLYISKWIAIWMLRAFLKCSGKSRAIDAWEELRERWTPSEAELDYIMRTLRPLMEGEDMNEKRFDWLLGSL
jgi:pentatricopeptide repeat protein